MAMSNYHVSFSNGVPTSSVGSIDFQGKKSHFEEPREAPRIRLRDIVLGDNDELRRLIRH